MLFLQYPPCTTCKKARAWLDTHGIAYEARHIKEQNPSFEELSRWLEITGRPLISSQRDSSSKEGFCSLMCRAS